MLPALKHYEEEMNKLLTEQQYQDAIKNRGNKVDQQIDTQTKAGDGICQEAPHNDTQRKRDDNIIVSSKNDSSKMITNEIIVEEMVNSKQTCDKLEKDDNEVNLNTQTDSVSLVL